MRKAGWCGGCWLRQERRELSTVLSGLKNLCARKHGDGAGDLLTSMDAGVG